MRLRKKSVELAEILKRQEQAGGQEKNRLHRATRNGAWLSAVPHRLNGRELSRDEFQDNLCLRYGLMPQDIPATCNGCGKKFSIEHALSCPKWGLVLAQNYDAAKEWGSLGARDLVPSDITWERTGVGARQEGGEANGSTDTAGEAQGGRGRTVNGAARVIGQPGQVVSPA